MCRCEALNCCSHFATLRVKLPVEDAELRESDKWSPICEDIKNLWITLYLKPDPLLDFLVTWVNNKSPFLLKPTKFRFLLLEPKAPKQIQSPEPILFVITLFCCKTLGWTRVQVKACLGKKRPQRSFLSILPTIISTLPASPVHTCALLMKTSRS